MKTIRYSFFGASPKNMDDCLDYFSKQPTNNKPQIKVRLTEELRATEEYLANSILGKYTWSFSDGTLASYDKVYGGFLYYQAVHKKTKIKKEADLRFRKDLALLASLGMNLEVLDA